MIADGQLKSLKNLDYKSIQSSGRRYGKNTIGYLMIAKINSMRSTHPKFKMGCVIHTKDGAVGGFNQIKTHPKSTAPYHMLHAEIDTILNAVKHKYDLEGATIYIYRETKDGNFAMAKPCDGCMIAIRKMKIAKVVYTTNGGIGCLSL